MEARPSKSALMRVVMMSIPALYTMRRGPDKGLLASGGLPQLGSPPVCTWRKQINGVGVD
ncbi:MAG: hypothetical protein V8K32_05925 [Candidatus Electrothrix gigas]